MSQHKFEEGIALNKKAGLLACSIGLTSILFAGCNTDNDNKVSKNNVGRTNRISTYNTDRGYHTEMYGNQARTYNHPGYYDRGYSTTTPGTMLGEAGRNVGEAARDLGRGTVNMAQNAGNAIGNAARDITGMNNNNNNNTDHTYSNHYNARGNHANNLNNSNGMGATSTGNTTNLTTLFGENKDVLMLGNLMIVAGNGQGTTTGTTTGTTSGNTTGGVHAGNSNTANHGSLNRIAGTPAVQANQYGHGALIVMHVHDAKGKQALKRVNQTLQRANTKANAASIAKDIQIVLKHATPTTNG